MAPHRRRGERVPRAASAAPIRPVASTVAAVAAALAFVAVAPSGVRGLLAPPPPPMRTLSTLRASILVPSPRRRGCGAPSRGVVLPAGVSIVGRRGIRFSDLRATTAGSGEEEGRRADDDVENGATDDVGGGESSATTAPPPAEIDVDGTLSSWNRLVAALPKLRAESDSAPGRRPGDDLDRKILTTALPTMLNLMVVPLVNAVDTFYVGRLADPLALAGQAAANQCFFAVYFLAAFLPTITAPLVATAIGSGDLDAARERVCESLFLGNVLGGLFSVFLMGWPRVALRMVLPQGSEFAAATEFAAPYLRWRAAGMIPALFSATGFAAYRGLLNTVTPLKVSLTTNLLNIVADPLFLFGLPRGLLGGPSSPLRFLAAGFGSAGAAMATALSETVSGLIYLKLLFRRGLVRWSKLLRPPRLESLIPLVQGGFAMLLRQATLNVAFVYAARRAQAMDPSGISAAAYGIVMQIYSLGVVAQLGIQGTAAALVPSSRAVGGDGAAREVADRIFLWGSLLGVALAAGQYFALPMVAPLFSPLPEVQRAVRGPAAISSVIHLVNGLVFAGEGTLLGLGAFRDLSIITAMGVGVMVSCLASPLGKRLDGVLWSLAAFSLFQGLAVTFHHIRISPLARRRFGFLGRNGGRSGDKEKKKN